MVSMGTVWDRTTEFLSDNLSAIFPIAFLAIYLPGVLSSSLEPLTTQSGATAMMIQLLSLILTLVAAWGQLAITALALDPGGGGGVAAALASRRFLPLIGLGILLFVGMFVLVLPVPLAFALVGFDFKSAMNGGASAIAFPAGLGIFVSIYILVLAALLLWLGARLALITPVVLKEAGGIAALRRSFGLTRRIAWKILGVIVLYMVVFGVAVLAAKLVFGSILRLVSGGDGPVTVGTVTTALLVGIVVTAFSVLASAFTGRLYLAARDAREAIVDSL